MKVVSTANAPAAIGPYSQALDLGNMVFVSGQLPVDPATGTMADTVEQQAAQSLANLKAILAKAGLSMNNVGKTVNTAGDIFAAPSEPFLDFDLMYGTEAFVKTPHAESWGRERSGVDYEEMVDNMWQELGISVSSLGFTNQGAPTPTRSKLFSGSFDHSFTLL